MLSIILSIFPSFLHVLCRRLLGQKIGAGVKLRFGTIIKSPKIEIHHNCQIGPFCYIDASVLRIGAYSRLKPFVFLSTFEIFIGRHVTISPLSVIKSKKNKSAIFRIGDHSCIFPFCWLEPGAGIDIGQQTGIGGHTLIFTHGVWPNYLEGGPVSRGKVSIGNHVWIPWRVFIMPGITIGDHAVIGAGTVITKSVAPNNLVVGVEQKIVRDVAYRKPTPNEQEQRVKEILGNYADNINASDDTALKDGFIMAGHHKISLSPENLTSGDILILLNSINNTNALFQEYKHKGILVIDLKRNILHSPSGLSYVDDFVLFLKSYGIRLYVNEDEC